MSVGYNVKMSTTCIQPYSSFVYKFDLIMMKKKLVAR